MLTRIEAEEVVVHEPSKATEWIRSHARAVVITIAAVVTALLGLSSGDLLAHRLAKAGYFVPSKPCGGCLVSPSTPAAPSTVRTRARRNQQADE